MRINFIAPSTSTVMGGGIRVIFRHANYLAEHGHDVMVYVPMIYFIGKKFILKTTIANSITRRARLDWMEHSFKTKAALRISDAFIRDADVTIATAWHTAPAVNKLSPCKGKKVYFIQAYEIWNQDEKEVDATYMMNMHRIVITNKLHELLKAKFGVESSIVYDGHDSKEYLHGEKRINTPRNLMMLWASAYFKGCKEALEVLYRLHAKYAFNITLFSVEPQPAGLPDYVTFYHRPERSQLISLYQQADIYVFPSLNESWGLPAMEAMANKCAVVGMRTGMLEDVCQDGKQALVAEIGNYQELEEKLLAVLDSVNLMKHLQECGYQFSLDFSWDKQCELFENELFTAVNN